MNIFNKLILVLIMMVGRVQSAALETPVLFVHGIADTYQQAFRYYNLGIFKKPFYSFNFPDATQSIMRVKRKKTVFGQLDEVVCLQQAYQQVVTLHYDEPIVLYGVSRGASTVVNFVALQKPNQVKALILESPFADLSDVMTHVAHKLPKGSWYVNSLSSWIFPRYDKQGIKPLELINEIPKDMPILLLCSLADDLVPASSTIRLYEALKAAGCTQVHLVKLNVAAHAKMFFSPDWPLYKQAIHAFYKRYGIAHDPVLAQQGEWLLENA